MAPGKTLTEASPLVTAHKTAVSVANTLWALAARQFQVAKRTGTQT
jgi:hypothetical protein